MTDKKERRQSLRSQNTKNIKEWNAGAKKVDVNAPFAPSHKYYNEFEHDLKRVSVQVGKIINSHKLNGHNDVMPLITKLLAYRERLGDFATEVAKKFVKKIAVTNAREWQAQSRLIGKKLEHDVQTDKIQALLAQIEAQTRFYVQKLPEDAVEKVREYSIDAYLRGERWETVQDKILKIPGMNYRHAKLVARTEGAIAASQITMARAQAIGCTHFIWRAVLDNRTRPSHRAMNGKVCEYLDPPIVEGQPLIPGQIYNCRCHAEPIINI